MTGACSGLVGEISAMDSLSESVIRRGVSRKETEDPAIQRQGRVGEGYLLAAKQEGRVDVGGVSALALQWWSWMPQDLSSRME